MKSFVLRTANDTKLLLAFLKANCKAMADKKTPIVVSLSEWKAKRSVEQNKRHWKMMHFIAENAWVDGRQFSAEVWHEQFCRSLIGAVELPDGGKIGMPSSKLSVGEFLEFSDKCERYARDVLGCDFTGEV